MSVRVLQGGGGEREHELCIFSRVGTNIASSTQHAVLPPTPTHDLTKSNTYTASSISLRKELTGMAGLDRTNGPCIYCQALMLSDDEKNTMLPINRASTRDHVEDTCPFCSIEKIRTNRWLALPKVGPV